MMCTHNNVGEILVSGPADCECVDDKEAKGREKESKVPIELATGCNERMRPNGTEKPDWLWHVFPDDDYCSVRIRG